MIGYRWRARRAAPPGAERRSSTRSAYRLLFLIAGAVLLGACRGGPRLRSPDPLPAAWSQYQQGLAALWKGDRGSARPLFENAVRLDGRFVAAHRQLQNLGILEHRRGALLRDYGTLAASDPEDPRLLYLHGRLLTDPERQRVAFRRAYEKDRSDPWPLLGLGHLALAEGELREAQRWFEAGLKDWPDHRELRLGYAQLLLVAKQYSEAREYLAPDAVLREEDELRIELEGEALLQEKGPSAALRYLGAAVARFPANEAHAEQLRRRFAEHGTLADAQWLSRELAGAAGAVNPVLSRLLFLVATAAGDAGFALEMAGRCDALSSDEHGLRRLLLFREGRLAEAFAAEGDRMQALERLGFPNPEFARAAELAARLQAGEVAPDAREWCALASSVRSLGWTEEALAVLRTGGVESSDAGAVLGADLVQQLRIEAELETRVNGLYFAYDEQRAAPEFDQFLEDLGQVFQRVLGVDLMLGSRRLSFGPLGVMLDPDPDSGGGVARYFAERGRLAVVGRRFLRPPEFMLIPAFQADRAGPQSAYLVFGEGVRIPSYLQHQGVFLSGAALHCFAYLDVGGIEAATRRMLAELTAFRSAAPRILADPVLPAASARERRDCTEPTEITLKLRFRALVDAQQRNATASKAAVLAEAIDEVFCHETGHLYDAQELLTPGLHWFSYLGTLILRRFSPERVEAWLEMRAQCAALLRARNSYLALASCTEYLPESRNAGSPHAAGYEELVRRFVAELDRNLARFPQIRRDANLLQQLDLLEPADIRWLAGRVARDLGLPEQR